VINCASTYPAVLLQPGHRKNRALGPARLETGQGLPRGRRHLLISAKRQRRCRNAPLPNGDTAPGLCDPVDLWT
jgi:hypothetical protein